MGEESSSDEECPQLVPIEQHSICIRGENKVPVTIITGFLGEM